jgi:hypothetical protein
MKIEMSIEVPTPKFSPGMIVKTNISFVYFLISDISISGHFKWPGSVSNIISSDYICICQSTENYEFINDCAPGDVFYVNIAWADANFELVNEFDFELVQPKSLIEIFKNNERLDSD